MLTTPLGCIEIYIDRKRTEFMEKSIEVSDKLCPDLDKRYSIEVNIIPDGKPHVIFCKIKEYTPSKEDKIESGERLELKSFYRENTKLSIGMEGEAGYSSDGIRASAIYDYDNEYTENGVSYLIGEKTKTTKYVFGVAWINNVTKENDVQTWYGADPTLF